MSTNDTEIKVTFAPGAFDSFEGTQEELDALLAEIHRMVNTGELFENSTPITEDEFDELPDAVKAQLLSQIESFEEDGVIEAAVAGRTLQ